MSSSQNKILDPEDYKVVWIAPLFVEARAALLMLDAKHEGKFITHQGDDYLYMAGEINRHNVVIATFPAGQDYGVGSAAALASQVKKTFPKLWFGLLVGIAAGLPNLEKKEPLDIRLGDVLVGMGDSGSAGLISYGLGKRTADGFELLHHGYQAKTVKIIRSAIGMLQLRDTQLPATFIQYYENISNDESQAATFADPGQDNDELLRTVYDGVEEATGFVDRPKRSKEGRTRVWYGSIGSGDILMKDAKTRNELRDKHNIIGLEMEAAGIGNVIPVGVIRGVCDYGDARKNDDWQPYAAAMAAAYAKAILCEILPEQVATFADTGTVAKDRRISQEKQVLTDLPSTLPNYSNHQFSGRTDELSWITKQLKQCPVLHQRVCLYGLGSIGKSEIAFKYAQEVSSHGHRAVFWVKADTVESLVSGYAAIASKVFPNFNSKNLNKAEVCTLVKEYLEGSKSPDWFMVLDGADNPEIFSGDQEGLDGLRYIPQASHGQILITSRDEQLHVVATSQLISPQNGLQVGPMSIQDGTALFQKLTPQDKRRLHAHILAPEGAKFLDMLGGLPLAIIQATSYLIHRGIKIQAFIDLYEKFEAHGKVFGFKARDIDNNCISVLRTWEISYVKIAEDVNLTTQRGLPPKDSRGSQDCENAEVASKSHAAVLLDLLGFIDSKSHPILRKMSEADFVFKDTEGSNPMDGFRDIQGHIFKPQSSPKGIVSRVFATRISSSEELEFDMAISSLQRYYLIDEDCWVPPVVHSWIAHRLKPEEKCKYIQWLVDELWGEILLQDNEFDTHWEDNLLPPHFHELVVGELPPLRHARILLEHASTKEVLESMTVGTYLAHDTVDLLYRLGRMLAAAGMTKEGVYWLEKAIAVMQSPSLLPPADPLLVSERKLQLAKTRFDRSEVTKALAEAKSLATSTPSNRATLWLAQCHHSAGELEDALTLFRNILRTLGRDDDPDCQRVVFASAVGVVNALSTENTISTKKEVRDTIDAHLIPVLQRLRDGDTLKVVLFLDILTQRLIYAENANDEMKVAQPIADYDNRLGELSKLIGQQSISLVGGKPEEWGKILRQLRYKKRWTALQALCKAYLGKRYSYQDLWKKYQNNRDLQLFNQLFMDVEAWLVIYCHLGTAYTNLNQHEAAEQTYWDALGLRLFSLYSFHGAVEAQGRIDSPAFKTILFRLDKSLASQEKYQLHHLLWCYFAYTIPETESS